MKLIYQHLLAFLLIILLSASIVGYTAIQFVREQAYQQNFQRMDSYAASIGSLVESKQVNGQNVVNPNFLDQLQFVLRRDDVHFWIFNAQNRQIYPQVITPVRVDSKTFTSLKKGHELRIYNNNQQRLPGTPKLGSYSGVLVPWRENGHLIGFIWIGCLVRSVVQPIEVAKRRMLVALTITFLVGLFLSWILSYYYTYRIKRLSLATDKVAAGNFNIHLHFKQGDEIDQLANNFNKMVIALKKSRKEIKAQERRREEFFADAAHEMRTPLTTINGLLEGLQYNALPEKEKPKSIALMRHETQRLIRLVNENIDYEKIRSNQVHLNKANFDAVPVVKALRTQLNKNAQKSDDQLLLDLPQQLFVYADHDRFIQIMVNLIQNAIQFTQNGRIIVRGKRQTHAAQISVQDNGIGMKPEQRKYIFERFFKADPSRAHVGAGESGLGLSIVDSLVKQHKGKIRVRSKFKVGSTFTVILFDSDFVK